MTDTPTPRDPAEVVTTLWHRIWIEGDLDSLTDLVADPYVRHTREGTLRQTPQQYADTLASAIETIRGTAVTVDDLHVADDAQSDGSMVMARLTLDACNMTTGDPVRIAWLAHYRVVHGQVAESWVLHETGLDWSEG